MKVELIYEHKRFYPNGDISEITIWKVEKSKDKPYGYKYSLVYIREGKRIIGYDNAEKKGTIGIMKTGNIHTFLKMWINYLGISMKI